MRIWKSAYEKLDLLGSEWRNSSELLKLDILLKIVCVESSESVRGELVEKVGRGEEVRPESEMPEDWR